MLLGGQRDPGRPGFRRYPGQLRESLASDAGSPSALYRSGRAGRRSWPSGLRRCGWRRPQWDRRRGRRHLRGPGGRGCSRPREGDELHPAWPYTLCAWVDGAVSGVVDGLFQDSEGQCQAGALVGGVANYVFDWNIPNLVQVLTYARFRVSTDPLTTADGGLGTAADGEVEDYALSILPTRASIGSFRVDSGPGRGVGSDRSRDRWAPDRPALR